MNSGTVKVLDENQGYAFVNRQINKALNRITHKQIMNNTDKPIGFIKSIADCLNDQHPMMIPNEINFNFDEDCMIQFDLVWHIVKEGVPQNLDPYKDKTLIIGKTLLSTARDLKSKQTVSLMTHHKITNLNTVGVKGEEYVVVNYNHSTSYEGLFDYHFGKEDIDHLPKITKKKMYENWTAFFNDHFSFLSQVKADTIRFGGGNSLVTEYPTKEEYTDFLKYKLKDENGT